MKALIEEIYDFYEDCFPSKKFNAPLTLDELRSLLDNCLKAIQYIRKLRNLEDDDSNDQRIVWELTDIIDECIRCGNNRKERLNKPQVKREKLLLEGNL